MGNGLCGRTPITTTHDVMGHGVIGTGGRQGLCDGMGQEVLGGKGKCWIVGDGKGCYVTVGDNG